MRIAFLLLLVACSDKTPAAPAPKEFAALDEDAKCAATLPRAKKCADELLAAEFESLAVDGSEADKKATAELSKGLSEEQSSSDEAEAMHAINCHASEGYPGAVVACWAEPDCKTFARCVMKKDLGIRPHSGATSPSPKMTLPSDPTP